jgi:prevent-host-death family protein
VKKVSTHEAKTHLSRLLAAVAAGEEVVILRGSTPAAKLVPLTAASPPGRPAVGTLTSAPVQWSEDAFAPLQDDELANWGL